MPRITEVRRPDAEGLSQREIAASVGVPKTAVREYLRRANELCLLWPLLESTDDIALEATLLAAPVPVAVRPLPDSGSIHKELDWRTASCDLVGSRARSRTGFVITK
jgi:hypothetical protein